MDGGILIWSDIHHSEVIEDGNATLAEHQREIDTLTLEKERILRDLDRYMTKNLDDIMKYCEYCFSLLYNKEIINEKTRTR